MIDFEKKQVEPFDPTFFSLISKKVFVQLGIFYEINSVYFVPRIYLFLSLKLHFNFWYVLNFSDFSLGNSLIFHNFMDSNSNFCIYFIILHAIIFKLRYCTSMYLKNYTVKWTLKKNKPFGPYRHLTPVDPNSLM